MEAQEVRQLLQEANVSRPPASFVSWLTLVGLLLTVGTGGVGYGILINKVDGMAGLAGRISVLEQSAAVREARVDALEHYDPLSVDRRMGVVEGKLGSIESQIQEVLRQLRLKPNKDEGL